MSLHLVSDWRRAYRWYSVHGMSVGAILSACASALALATSAGSLAGVLPIWGVFAVFCSICLASLAGRFIDQSRHASTAPQAKF